MDKLIEALREELHDVLKYAELAKTCEYGSMLMDIAREEYTHAENIKYILSHKDAVVPAMTAEWEAAKRALWG